MSFLKTIAGSFVEFEEKPKVPNQTSATPTPVAPSATPTAVTPSDTASLVGSEIYLDLKKSITSRMSPFNTLLEMIERLKSVPMETSLISRGGIMNRWERIKEFLCELICARGELLAQIYLGKHTTREKDHVWKF